MKGPPGLPGPEVNKFYLNFSDEVQNAEIFSVRHCYATAVFVAIVVGLSREEYVICTLAP